MANDSDPDGDPIWISDYDDVPTASGTVTCDVAGGCEFVAARGYSGTTTFDYVLTDGSATAKATVTVTVQAPANQAPKANDDSALVQDGGSVTVAVLGNDSDPDGATSDLTVRITSGPAAGTANVNANGSITYQHNPNSRQFADSLMYEVSDASGATDTARVTLTVNRPPIARADQVERWTGEETDTFNPVTGAGTEAPASGADSDPDAGDTPRWSRIVTGPARGTGTVSCSGSGTCTYTPPDTSRSHTATFTYEIVDGRGGSATARVTVEYRYFG